MAKAKTTGERIARQYLDNTFMGTRWRLAASIDRAITRASVGQWTFGFVAGMAVGKGRRYRTPRRCPVGVSEAEIEEAMK